MTAASTIVEVIDRHVAQRGRDGILVGLIGRGIQLSRTPMMHEREGARLGMRCTYVLLDFDAMNFEDGDLDAVLTAASTLGFAGVNVTHPFKQAVIPHLTDIAPEAAAIGAVNTIVFSKGGLTGHNTDCWGFAESFRDKMSGCPLDRVVQFGAGGAGAAVAYALLGLGVGQLAIIDKDTARAEGLATRFGANKRVIVGNVEEALLDADGIVNTTPVGMTKYPGLPFPADLLSSRHWVAEIVYFPLETELLGRARALGCRTLAGTGMAVYQAVRAFELFTGMAADRVAMHGHFEAAA